MSAKELFDVIAKLPNAKTYGKDEVYAIIKYIEDDGEINETGGMKVVFQKNKQKDGWDILLTSHLANRNMEEGRERAASNQ